MKQKIVERIESELLSTLIKYIVPSINKKVKAKREGNLENLINNSKPKVGFEDIKELEKAVLESSNAKVKREFSFDSKFAFYSSAFTRKKSKSIATTGYSVVVKYEETQTSEMVSVKVKKQGKIVYSSEVKDIKPVKDKVAPYSVSIAYEDDYGEERLNISYKALGDRYLKDFTDSREDMSNMVPLKWLNIHPETNMGGVLGFTYIGDPSMGRRADLSGWMARMVDIHESIHTPDEYETRVLTSWIMERVRLKYKK